jgi:glutamate-1-semialdehyde 2,1-aminomutase
MNSESFNFGKTYRERALKSVAFGVSSTPRGRQLPSPIVTNRAENAHIFDETGNRFIDYSLGYGPLILGHSPTCVITAVQRELAKGMRTASVHKGEAELAELIAETVPCATLSSFVSSGSEAVHLALRTARAVTGKLPIIKFRGNYHGWFDNIHLANGVQNDGPSTIGQDPGSSQNIKILDWGDSQAFLDEITDDYAAVILEPVAVNFGCLYPPVGFLQLVRQKTSELGVILIFDEVITCYRLSLGGAQQKMDVIPDLAVIGKAMGGGLPIGAVTGSAAAMEPIASGRMLNRGTFNGNPISVAAAIACITHLRDQQHTLYSNIDATARELEDHATAQARQANVQVSVTRAGSALQIFLGTSQIETLADTANINVKQTGEFAAEMLTRGVQIISRGLMYMSSVHTQDDIDLTKRAFEGAFSAVAEKARRA